MTKRVCRAHAFVSKGVWHAARAVLKKIPTERYEAIYAVIRQIPKGKVATYGQIAQMAGVRTPRMVGYALRIGQDKTLPWHRVVNAKGEISQRWSVDSMDLQRKRLLSEGVDMKDHRVHLTKHRWHR